MRKYSYQTNAASGCENAAINIICINILLKQKLHCMSIFQTDQHVSVRAHWYLDSNNGSFGDQKKKKNPFGINKTTHRYNIEAL